MIGEKVKSPTTVVKPSSNFVMKNLSRKFSSSAITVCNNVMERKSNFKRTFSLRNIFNHKSSLNGGVTSNHGFTFKRTPSRKLDIYFPFIRG